MKNTTYNMRLNILKLNRLTYKQSIGPLEAISDSIDEDLTDTTINNLRVMYEVLMTYKKVHKLRLKSVKIIEVKGIIYAKLDSIIDNIPNRLDGAFDLDAKDLMMFFMLDLIKEVENDVFVSVTLLNNFITLEQRQKHSYKKDAKK